MIYILRPLVWVFCRLLFRIEFNGVENVPREGPCIIAPNHNTFADPIWITIPIKRRVYYMTWDRVFEIPVLGSLARIFGAFPVKLESVDPKAQREAIGMLKLGRAVVIFPEGGRSKTGGIEPFKMGAFRLALAHGVPIIPVTIDGGYQIWPVGRLLPRPGRLKITYHRPISANKARDGLSKMAVREGARQLAREWHAAAASALSIRPVERSDEHGIVEQPPNG
ncbi:MAG TPA: lysophospholipid acyltransferase family protein [Blastocatellia bacterium]|nr:lysophospholipid acyltransferase family protein [Blastocatellia bacterium]